MGEYLTTKEACKLLKISRPTLYKLIKEGKIPAVKVGRDYRILKTDIPTFLRKKHE